MSETAFDIGGNIFPMPNNDFFEFFERPTGSSDFVRLKDGDRVALRIISKPVAGHEIFVDGKPRRWKPDEPTPTDIIVPEGESIRQFAAFIVCEYDEAKPIGAVKIWSVNQKGILRDMSNLFGGGKHWTEFELILTRRGEGLRTQYSLTGVPRPMEPELLQFASESEKYIDLSKLYTGENPFVGQPPHVVPGETSNPSGLPF
jgi:hypothetical protein